MTEANRSVLMMSCCEPARASLSVAARLTPLSTQQEFNGRRNKQAGKGKGREDSKISCETLQFGSLVSGLSDFVHVWTATDREIINFVNTETGLMTVAGKHHRKERALNEINTRRKK